MTTQAITKSQTIAKFDEALAELESFEGLWYKPDDPNAGLYQWFEGVGYATELYTDGLWRCIGSVMRGE